MYASEFDSSANPILRFGRKKTKDYNIDVCFIEESTSKLHCTITYNKEKGKWIIVDSDGIGIKKSLNGTWYLADEDVVISTGTIIRVGTTTMEATIKE